MTSAATLPAPLRVTATRQETADTWTLDLAAPGRPPFAPGQFSMLYAFGAGEVPISMSGDPRRPGVLTHTVRAVGSTTRAVCALREGEAVGVRGPFGRGWPMDSAEGGDLVIAAGGLGLAPLRPAVYAALAARDRFRRVVLLYGGRDPAGLLFRGELDAWASGGALEAETTVDAARPGWRGRVGVVPELLERADLDPGAAVAFCCGPEMMMRLTAEALIDRGIAAERIHVSLERNMRCAVGHCGHCQLAGTFVCRDGPVFAWDEIAHLLAVREL